MFECEHVLVNCERVPGECVPVECESVGAFECEWV